MNERTSQAHIWQEKIAGVLANRQKSLAKVKPTLELPTEDSPRCCTSLPRHVLTDTEISLTENYSASELVVLMTEKKVTAEEVTRAFLRRAAIAQHATNCLTELLWDEAIERARYLDSLPEPAGPLHGLPISTKENQGMRDKGKTCSSSYVCWIDSPSEHIYLHDILWDAGCVFYARTNQPQSVMHLETNNNIYGRTLNPCNRTHTSGGSSGGEGTLLGMRGSLVGLGGDIGGSVRVPAAFNGVYGFKPTTTRLPEGTSRTHMLGHEAILGVNGFLCTDRDSISLLMKVVLDAEPWRKHPSVYPQPWTPPPVKLTARDLKVAIQWSDGIVKPHPPVRRALREVRDACVASGMKVVDWTSPPLLDGEQSWHLTSALYFPDGGKDIKRLLEQGCEEPLPLTKFIIDEQPTVKDRTQKELWDLCVDRDTHRRLHAQYWTNSGSDDGHEVDVILTPVHPGAAPPHDRTRYWNYTSAWNLLDYPAVTFPVTSVSDVEGVDEEDDKEEACWNDLDRENREMYNKEEYVGLPVGLQLVARRNYDEKLLAALEVIECAMGR